MRHLLWAMSTTFGSLGIFILYFILIGRLSLALGAYAVICLAAAVAICCSLPHIKDKDNWRG
jgi:1,4-dihydroxy-2-naphthoate octaprenyltransferase